MATYEATPACTYCAQSLLSVHTVAAVKEITNICCTSYGVRILEQIYRGKTRQKSRQVVGPASRFFPGSS